MKQSTTVCWVSFVSLIALAVPVYSQSPAQRRQGEKNRKADPSAESIQQGAALYEAAQVEHQRGNLTKAIELYGQAISRDPDLWQAELQRATAYLALNDLVAARRSITQVSEQLKQFSDAPELRQAMARAQLLAGEIALAEAKPEEAEQAFHRALEMNPQAARAHAGLAEIYLASNKPDEAIAQAQAALAAGDRAATTYLLLGTAQVRSGKNAEAVASFGEALQLDPKNKFALLARAEAFAATRKFDEAIQDLRAALALEATTQTKLRLAQLLTQTRRTEEAATFYRQVLQDDPNNSEARAALAAAMIDTGKGAEAIPQLEAMVKAEPDRAVLHAQLGELYLKTQPERALAEYTAAAKLEPAQPSQRVGVGAALVKLRRFDEAAAALRAALAVELKEDAAYAAHANLATALFELDDYQNAAREFLWLLNHQLRTPGDRQRAAVALYFLGVCFDKLGDFEQALKAYEQFLTVASTENQLEIDKVKLRLPPLQRQIKAGQGKRKP